MPLSQKHLDILELLSDPANTRQEISDKVGINDRDLRALINGDSARMGPIALEFKTEYQKILSKKNEEAKHLFKENRAFIMMKLNARLRKMMPDRPTKDMTAELCQMLNSMAKMGPQVEIGEVHTHYHLTKEERTNEFKRLVAAVSQDVRGRLSKSVGRGSAESTKSTGTRAGRPKA